MAIDLGTLLALLGPIRNWFREYRREATAKDYERQLSGAIADLLRVNPDIDQAEVLVAAAEEAGVKTADLYRTKRMLSAVKTYGTSVKKKKATKKKATKKKKVLKKKGTKKRKATKARKKGASRRRG